VSLIEAEQDDEATLRAEDEAILAAEAPEQPESLPAIPRLIEDIFNGNTDPEAV